MRQPQTIAELVTAAQLDLSKYQVADWFANCSIKGDALLVPSAKAGADILRLFGIKLTAVLPNLRVVVSQRPVGSPKSPFKKGHEPQQGDLL